jgi:hypothetical protein
VSEPRLRIVTDVDGQTGEVQASSPSCPRCREVEIEDVENLQSEVLRLNRKIKAMKRDRDAERLTDPQRWEILRLIEYWKTATGHPRARFSGDRFDLVKARLTEGYSPDEIELAIDGIAAKPYVGSSGRMATGEPGQRHDRLGICLKGGEDLERFAVIGHEARSRA